MKKIYFLASAVAALVAVSCAKEQGKVDKPSPTPAVTEEEDTTPVPILFGSKLNIVETKAAVLEWDNAHTPQSNALYIYGLEDVGTVEAPAYKLTSKTREQSRVREAFINNVLAVPPTSAAAAANPRTAIEVFNPDGENDEPFYYAENVKYNFFGYYVDDAYTGNAPTPAVDTASTGVINKITLPVTINGTQDILLAKTDKEEDLINRTVIPGKAIGSIDRLYSSYSARRGVNPNLNFEHQLSRFVFSIKKGGTVDGDKITISSLKVESYAAGTLTIVGAPTEVSNQGWNKEQGEFIPVNSKQNLYLVPETEDNENPVARTYLPITTLNDDTPIQAGNTLEIHPGADYAAIGDIMVYPGQDVYNFDLDILQDGITATIPTQHLQIEMAKVIKNGASAGVQFAEPGKQYNVNLIVYGAEEVVITVTLSDWEEVGEINIDPDEQDEIDSYVPTLSFAANEIVAGATTQATVSVTKDTEPVTTGLAITYESKNPNVATVSETGLVTGVAAGTAKIVAKITVTVNEVALGTIIAAKNITVTAAPLPTPEVTVKFDGVGVVAPFDWHFDPSKKGEVIVTISGDADVNDAEAVWSYIVEDNDYFTIDGEGKVTLKADSVNPYPATVPVTFTVTLNAKAGVYNQSSQTATINVCPEI